MVQISAQVETGEGLGPSQNSVRGSERSGRPESALELLQTVAVDRSVVADGAQTLVRLDPIRDVRCSFSVWTKIFFLLVPPFSLQPLVSTFRTL